MHRAIRRLFEVRLVADPAGLGFFAPSAENCAAHPVPAPYVKEAFGVASVPQSMKWLTQPKKCSGAGLTFAI
jgi:hypothetical protein